MTARRCATALTAAFTCLAGVAAAITPVGVLTYTAPARPGAIELLLRRNGTNLELLDGGAEALSQPLAAVTAVQIGGPDATDTTLTVDFGPGAIPVPIAYHPGVPGQGTDNVLALRGGAFAHESHLALGPHSGVITLDGVPIAYDNLTPIDTTVMAAVFTYNATAGADTINVIDGPTVGGIVTTQVNSNGASELINVANKTTIEILTLGGDDQILVHNPNPAAGLTAFTIDGGDGTDTLAVDGAASNDDALRLTNAGPASGSVIDDWAPPALAPLSFAGIEALQLELQGDPNDQVRVDGTAGNDALTFTQAASLDGGTFTGTMDQNNATGHGPFALVPTSFKGTPVWVDWDLNISVRGGTDTFTFSGTGDDETMDVFDPGVLDSEGVSSVVGGTPRATLKLFAFSAIALHGNGGSDTFNVPPRPTVPVDVVGGSPTPPDSPGDVLNIVLTGVTAPMLSATYSTVSGYAGGYTFGNRAAVTFSQVEGRAPTAGDVGVTKTDGQTSDTPGTSISYTLVVSHVGGDVGAGGIAVADTFPAALTDVSYTALGSGGASGFTAAGSGNIADTVSLPAGAAVTYTVTASIAPSATGTLSNTATLTVPSGIGDTNATNDSATDTTGLVPSADVAVQKSGPAAAEAGGDLTYLLSVANLGPSDAQAVSLTDPLPAGTAFVSLAQTSGPAFACDTPAPHATGTVTCTIATLAAGASAAFTLVVHVAAGMPGQTVLENTATVASSTADPSSDNASSSARALLAGAVPAAGVLGMALLAALLAAAGALALRR